MKSDRITKVYHFEVFKYFTEIVCHWIHIRNKPGQCATYKKISGVIQTIFDSFPGSDLYTFPSGFF